VAQLSTLGSIERMNNSEPPIWFWLLPLAMLTFGLVYLFRRPAFARSVLQRWASSKRYEILRFERCFYCGQFPLWTTSHKQMVFFVTIRDDSGRERSCWLRFGSIWSGGFNAGYKNEPDIIWSDTNAA
jgi:hypothetical protein